ncbi:hypothetical protein [Cyanobium gracile]|uniref:Uncharacterized protein n=1 Tax=Cyanobium gracile (strain ATCC 27147 / PCC 6307) TaxID=292564 RepID=K9P7Y0_CYAGP|nr:hypothetical protein [Cyanobium gracile]AFY28674.1 hypothetical protein Cyagr_1510 [Cyanobium gracile PCC 6307]
MAMPLLRQAPRLFPLAGVLLVLLLPPAAALACDTGSESPSQTKAKKR